MKCSSECYGTSEDACYGVELHFFSWQYWWVSGFESRDAGAIGGVVAFDEDEAVGIVSGF